MFSLILLQRWWRTRFNSPPRNRNRFIGNCVRMRFKHINKIGPCFCFISRATTIRNSTPSFKQTYHIKYKRTNTNTVARRIPCVFNRINLVSISFPTVITVVFRKRHRFHTDASTASFVFPNQQLTTCRVPKHESKIFSIAFIVNGARDTLDFRVKIRRR